MASIHLFNFVEGLLHFVQQYLLLFPQMILLGDCTIGFLEFGSHMACLWYKYQMNFFSLFRQSLFRKSQRLCLFSDQYDQVVRIWSLLEPFPSHHHHNLPPSLLLLYSSYKWQRWTMRVFFVIRGQPFIKRKLPFDFKISFFTFCSFTFWKDKLIFLFFFQWDLFFSYFLKMHILQTAILKQRINGPGIKFWHAIHSSLQIRSLSAKEKHSCILQRMVLTLEYQKQ